MPSISTLHNQIDNPSLGRYLLVGFLLVLAAGAALAQQPRGSLTPLQAAIEDQQRRLQTGDVEERRDALMRLSSLRHPAASRAAAVALSDSSPTVRVAAASAVLGMPGNEAAVALLPLLKDKDEFVRQETAYALGKTKSRLAVGPLIELVGIEKLTGPRGAAVVALGELGDETAVVQVSQLLAPSVSATTKKKPPAEKNEFVLRAAARSLGQIRSRAGVPALLATLEKSDNPSDLRREAAIALGMIGAPESVAALRRALDSEDPHLVNAASESLRRIAQQ